MNTKPRNYRAFYKPDNIIYNVWGIKFENGDREIAIKNEYVKSNDIILMEGTGKKDIRGRELFEGDIVQIIKPVNIIRNCPYKDYENGVFNGFGYVYYNPEKRLFLWGGFVHGAYPEFTLSGKEFLIVGNVFHNTELFLNKEGFSINGMGEKLGNDYHLWIQNKRHTNRQVLFEKNQYIKLGDKEYKSFLEKRKLSDSLKNMAIRKKEERYKKIYFEMKEKLENKENFV